MVDTYKIIVYGLGYADDLNIHSVFYRILLKPFDSVHGIIAADVEEIADVVPV